MSDSENQESASINAKVTGRSNLAMILMVILGSGGSTYAANQIAAPIASPVDIQRLERIEEKVNRLLTETERRGDDIRDLDKTVDDHEQRIRKLESQK